MKLKIVLQPSEDGGFTALVPALPGCVSEGETREDALINIREAIELYLEPVEDDLPAAARPSVRSSTVILVFSESQVSSYPFPGLLKRDAERLRDLSDEVVDLVVDHFREVPAPLTHVAFEHLGGAVARVPEEATACHSRQWPFDFLIVGMWDDPADDDRNVNWVRNLWSDLRGFAAEGAYTNYMAPETLELAAELKAAYGDETYSRLRALKKQYDPTNLFRLNQNIRPE